ncbi:MAG: hypothetical protein DRJ55_03405 [Thermoprotei archaeon]|nr:MAG: hypothetical protein DRJ46_00880 [Thermoprotei archaeon]RLE93735.1 MAG: hypothetical protein DRJ55_03405 [Thermoprotei archaeon]
MKSEAIIGAIVALVLILGIGVLMPYKLFDMVAAGVMDIWLAVGLSVLLWLGAGITSIIIFGIVYGTSKVDRWISMGLEEERRGSFSMTAYRARQRAMLEELDEAVELLREIRDILKEAGE